MKIFNRLKKDWERLFGSNFQNRYFYISRYRSNCCFLNQLAQYDDLQVLHLTASGDESAFALLYDKYSQKIYFLAYRFLKSGTAAEDVLQDVFVKIWNNRQKLTGILDFNAYLNVITRNHIFNQLRKQANEEKFLKYILTTSSQSNQQTFDTVLLKELELNFNKAVAKLPPQQKKVFQLSRLHGLRQEEIADYMKISLGTVKKHMVVSLRFIRNYLASEGRAVLLLLSLSRFFY